MSGNNPFTQAESRYRLLLSQFRNGQLSQAEFTRAQAACVVVDNLGRFWFPSSEPGQWLLWDGSAWQPYVRPVPQAGGPRPSAKPPDQPGSRATSGWRGKHWLTVLLVLLAIAIILGGVLLMLRWLPVLRAASGTPAAGFFTPYNRARDALVSSAQALRMRIHRHRADGAACAGLCAAAKPTRAVFPMPAPAATRPASAAAPFFATRPAQSPGAAAA